MMNLREGKRLLPIALLLLLSSFADVAFGQLSFDIITNDNAATLEPTLATPVPTVLTPETTILSTPTPASNTAEDSATASDPATYYDNDKNDTYADDSSSYYNGTSTGSDKYDEYGNNTGYGDDQKDSSYGSTTAGYVASAKKKYGDDFFYGAMSVAVLTLGLVIIVEAILHRVDMSALGKPFYQAVLDAVYRELAVLGIVELGIHIMSMYYVYDKNKKAIFADVHFLLFYTDIFNALQAVIQAYFTNRVSQRLWVQTEEVELHHYVEIREEYERVHQLLYDTQYNQNNLGLFNPNRISLKSKYRRLLVQVNFHELRVNFIKAYNLPIGLRLSDYLMRSEQSVMVSLVHISPTAWLWLTALCNLMYYLAGVIADVTGRAEASAQFYSITFFVGMVLFVLVSIGVDRKMRRIFMKIMKAKHLWAFDDDKDFEQDERLAEEQRNLFWLGDPHLVITIIQFMQFGYAIALSIVAVYWQDMQKDDDFEAYWYLLSSFFCYAAFVYVMARVIPRFTLCTNLGQLVDKKLLHEAVARHKLKEAERYREQEYLYADEYGEMPTGLFENNAVTSKSLTLTGTNEFDTNGSDGSPAYTEATVAATLSPSASAADLQLDSQGSETEVRKLKRKQSRCKARSEGVFLMQAMKSVEEDDGYASAEDNKAKSRQQRKKSTSDGVPLMSFDERSTATPKESDRDTLLVDFVTMDLASVKIALAKQGESTRTASGRVKSNSAGSLIKQMQAIKTGTTAVIATKAIDMIPSSLKLTKVIDDDVSVALSDVDDIRTVQRQKATQEEEPQEPFSLNKFLSSTFVSPSYRFVSHVLGTMICFFLVAMRVEGFLQKKCTVPEDDYSWDLPLQWSFLLELIWLCISLFISVVVLITFAYKAETNRREYKAIIAALMNVAIVSTCLGLLLAAESERCCGDSGESKQDGYYPAEESDSFYDGRFLQYSEEKVCKDATLECGCADFGYRVYGGLGSIEPWTALIALQAFRFIVANKIAKWFNLGEKNYHTHRHDHGHGHGNGVDPVEVIANAWQEAVAKHPDLVAKYGEFSGELLQAMLKLDVVKRRRGQSTAPLLIMGETSDDKNRLTLSVVPGGVDQENTMEKLELCTYPFECPSAQIIRSVRRCDRLYLPLLSKWSSVDVILTKHEMIYLDVDDNDECTIAGKTRARSMQQLIKTNGGLGMRLCDVTAGRRVLGHMSFADIVKVGVEREMAARVKSKGIEDLEASNSKRVHEMWQAGDGNAFDGSAFAKRWEEVHQDRLRVDTKRGTLYLRFYADLRDEEHHPERVAKEAGDVTLLHKDNAFNWAQSIVRICAKQLKQPLPHFGDGNNGELRDYLQIVSC